MADDNGQIEQSDALADVLAERRENRRAFFRAMGVAAALTGGAALASGEAQAQAAAPTDADVLNFALNFEYLEANFYSFVTAGVPLDSDASGTGTPGAATGGRQITFSDPLVGRFAREIAFNERAQVEFLRTQLGSAAIARPALDLSVSPTSAFSMAARSAGLIGQNDSFDPYASDENFLLAAFLFEETGVFAYKGAATLIKNKTYLEAAAGILAVEAYQAGHIRTTLYLKGLAMPNLNLIQATEAISNARDSLDGASDDDQGIAPIGNMTNIVPTDQNGIVFGRSAAETLNIGYLNKNSVSSGGFFPNGVNGTIRTSAAN